MVSRFLVRKCTNSACGLRYTILASDPYGLRCPACRSETSQMGAAFGRLEVPPTPAYPPGIHLEVLADNIRSAWNVGSILRASDGAGVGKVHLCGVSPSPVHEKVAKTALGAEFSVAWQMHPDGVEACLELRSKGYVLWALEGGPRAENLFRVDIPRDRPMVLVVGNELTGIDPGILETCERVVCLPMMGKKGSLNVAGALTAAVYALRFRS